MDPVTAAIIAAISLGVGVVQGNKAQEAQEEAQDIQTAQEQVRQRNQKIRQVREARIATARANQAASNVGISGSSLNIGGTGGIQTQLAGNLSMLEGEGRAAQGISGKLMEASKAQTLNSQIQAVGGMFNTFNKAGMFKSTTPPAVTPVQLSQTMVNPPV